MSFTPPGVTPASDFGVGAHPACILVDFKQNKSPEKFQASVVYIATYRDTESGAEKDDIIKFNGTKSDYYAGLRVERLHAIVGAECVAGQHPDFQRLLELSDGVFFTVEIVQNGNYLNIQDVRANEELEDMI